MSSGRFRFSALGFRVPLLVISPYAKHDHVSHVQYEFGSLLRFVEGIYALDHLSDSDKRANDLIDCFDFAQAPRSFTKIAAPHDEAFFLRAKPSLVPPDTD